LNKLSIYLIFVFYIGSHCLIAQSNKLIISFNTGISFSKPDKRVDFTRINKGVFVADIVTDNKASIMNEFFYNIYIEKKILRDVNIITGLGTSVIFNDVRRGVDYSYFHPKNEFIQLQGWFNDWYFNASVQPIIGINKKVYQNEKRTLSVGLNNSFSFSIYKISRTP